MSDDKNHTPEGKDYQQPTRFEDAPLEPEPLITPAEEKDTGATPWLWIGALVLVLVILYFIFR